MFKTRRFKQLYVPAPANCPALSQLSIPQQSLLQDVSGKEPVFIRQLEVYSSAIISGTRLQPTSAIASPADILNATLTFMVGTTAELADMPLAKFNPFIPNQANYSGGVQDVFLFADMRTIDWTQSYVTIINNAPTTTAFCYVFGVSYLYKSDIDRMTADNIDWDKI